MSAPVKQAFFLRLQGRLAEKTNGVASVVANKKAFQLLYQNVNQVLSGCKACYTAASDTEKVLMLSTLVSFILLDVSYDLLVSCVVYTLLLISSISCPAACFLRRLYRAD